MATKAIYYFDIEIKIMIIYGHFCIQKQLFAIINNKKTKWELFKNQLLY